MPVADDLHVLRGTRVLAVRIKVIASDAGADRQGDRYGARQAAVDVVEDVEPLIALVSMGTVRGLIRLSG